VFEGSKIIKKVVKLFGRKLPRRDKKGQNRKFRDELNDILVAFPQKEKRERGFDAIFARAQNFRHTNICN
jgi:hypothetical protein